MSDSGGSIHYPADKEKLAEKAQHHEWLSIAFLATIITVMGLTMGSSQAMKTMWLEDLLSIIPTSAVLIGFYLRKWKPTERFPYGYRRGVQIGFLASSVALFGFGLFLLGDSVYSLVIGHHPSIATVEILGTRIWLGWLMIAALVYASIPPAVLGYLKRPLATELHDKTIYTSASIDKGDWLSGVAAVAGIIGIAYGFWWADAAAAGFISFEIVKDGYLNLRNSVFQLMNMRPTSVSSKEEDPIFARVKHEIESLTWVNESQVRLREDGDILAGEAFVVPTNEDHLLEKLGDAGEMIKGLDWRLQDFNIVPVSSLSNGHHHQNGAGAVTR